VDNGLTFLLHLAWIVPLVLLIAFISSPRFRGDIAETRVRRLLSAGLEANLYTVFNDLNLPSGGGTVWIDHIVVSKFGIFVIKSCYARGQVSGSPVQARWQRRHWGRTVRFDNPMHTNQHQVEALQRLLEYPARAFVPVVVLVGHGSLKRPLPDHVVGPERLLAFIRKRTRQELTPEQANHALQKISDARLHTPGGWVLHRWRLMRLALALLLLAGLWLAFGDDLRRVEQEIEHASEQRAAPENFHPDGTPKTEREIWEDSLICAWSSDTGRCRCYEPGGEPAKISADTCRRLANRGSILER
jgi:hypothetical protein